MREDCIVFDKNGFHREIFDRVLGKWIPDDSWWHPHNESGQMISLCNTCNTLDEAVLFCKECGIKDIRKVGC